MISRQKSWAYEFFCSRQCQHVKTENVLKWCKSSSRARATTWLDTEQGMLRRVRYYTCISSSCAVCCWRTPTEPCGQNDEEFSHQLEKVVEKLWLFSVANDPNDDPMLEPFRSCRIKRLSHRYITMYWACVLGVSRASQLPCILDQINREMEIWTDDAFIASSIHSNWNTLSFYSIVKLVAS